MLLFLFLPFIYTPVSLVVDRLCLSLQQIVSCWSINIFINIFDSLKYFWAPVCTILGVQRAGQTHCLPFWRSRMFPAEISICRVELKLELMEITTFPWWWPYVWVKLDHKGLCRSKADIILTGLKIRYLGSSRQQTSRGKDISQMRMRVESQDHRQVVLTTQSMEDSQVRETWTEACSEMALQDGPSMVACTLDLPCDMARKLLRLP